MKVLHERLRRVIGFVDMLKRQRYPNANSYAKELTRRDREQNSGLTASARTIARDIAFLRDVLHCPLDYDQEAGGYALTDPRWVFPLQALGGPAFPHVLGNEVTATLPGYREGMYAPIVLADREAVDVQALLPLIVATHGTPQPDPAVTEAVLYGWSTCHAVRTVYTPRCHEPTTRVIEPHRFISNEGIWYVRAWCRWRQAPRTFALHRMKQAELLVNTFEPKPEILAETKKGNVLGLEEIAHAVVQASPESADFYAEREWFAGQYDRRLPDGSLEMLFPSAPKPILVGWILYNSPDLKPIAPEELRHEVQRKARSLSN